MTAFAVLGVENYVEQLAARGFIGFALIRAAGHEHGARGQRLGQFGASGAAGL
jgi:hypothetical protein